MSDLLAALDALRERLTEIPQADERRLQELKTEILGRKGGALTRLLGRPPSLEPKDRKTIGGAANVLKREFETALAARERALKRAAGAATGQDLTMPGRARWTGGLHLVTQVVDEICEIFHELGFTRAVGPEAESERNNFYALNFPHDHPALDAQDSFYVGDGVVLRTHTSPVQAVGVDGDPRVGDGASRRPRQLRCRQRALHRIRVRHGRRAHRDEPLRRFRHPAVLGG